MIVVELIGAHFVAPGEDVIELPAMIFGIILYGIMANIFYTLGWITEILWSDGDTSKTVNLRSRIFRKGLIFSAALTCMPAILITLMWMISAVKLQ